MGMRMKNNHESQAQAEVKYKSTWYMAAVSLKISNTHELWPETVYGQISSITNDTASEISKTDTLYVF